MQHTTSRIIIRTERTRTVQSRQKSYADRSRRFLEFDISDSEVLESIIAISNWITLPTTLLSIHNVFHVSMLRKYD